MAQTCSVEMNTGNFTNNKIFINNINNNYQIFNGSLNQIIKFNFENNCILPYASNMFIKSGFKLYNMVGSKTIQFEEAFSNECILPSKEFSDSNQFTFSSEFTKSSPFSYSLVFTESSSFTSSSEFTKLSQATYSDFVELSHFTYSSEFIELSHFSKTKETINERNSNNNNKLIKKILYILILCFEIIIIIIIIIIIVLLTKHRNINDEYILANDPFD